MKKFIISCFLSIFIGTLCFADTVINAGNVSGTWTKSNSPYKITGDITITMHSQLNIEPGVQVIFQGYYRISVFGSLVAKGTETDSIYFMKAVSDTSHLTDTTTTNGGWHGIIWDNPSSGYQMSDSSVFDYCVFKYSKAVRNDGTTSGGVINTNNFSRIKFSNCAFFKNIAKISGGAIYTTNTTGLIFQSCTFIANQAVGGVGGAFFSDWGSRPIILNCIFFRNKCKTDGGALYMISNSPVIQNCFIINNNAGWNGGAIYLMQCNAFIGNTIIANNIASGKGAVVIDLASPVLINNSIVNNLAQDNGGLVFWSSSGAEFYNNIIWGNKNQSSEYTQINIIESDQAPVFSHCIIQPGNIYSGAISYTNAVFIDTICSNPLFVNSTTGVGDTYNAMNANWRLSTNPTISPGINKGVLNNQTTKLQSIDLYNGPRIKNGFIDIGASEAHIGKISVIGTIKTNTLWIADTVLIIGNVIIKDSVKLTLSPGMRVIFQGQFKIDVSGTIVAIGDKNDSIIFTKSDTMIYTGWQGINFNNCQDGAQGALTHNDTSYLQYCTFEFAKNMNPYKGGAISVCFFSKIVISNCLFRKNTADYGAAILISSLSNPVIKNNLFYGNHTYHDGGAIAIDSRSQPVIMNNFITNNSCFGYIYSEGGGIYVANSNPVIVNNIISNNYALIGGGVCIANNSEPVFSNNSVIFNYASTGGGIFNDNTTTCDIYNTVFWGNHASNYSDEVDNEYKANFYNCNIKDYYVWDNFGGTWHDSANIISVDPGFIKLPFPLDSTGNGLQADYHISTFSGNINKGTTTNISGILLPETDIFGNSRINDGQIDIGAVESQGNKLMFIQQPVGASLCEGNAVTLSIVLSDTAKIQWQKDGQDLPGDTNKTFKIDSLKEYKDQGNYICVAWNAFGKVYSNPVLLQVLKNPTITEQPEGGMISLGEVYKLDSRADGSTPLNYQWFKDGDSLPDENLFRLQIDSFAHLNEGTYLCRVSNNCGTITSQSATLSLAPQICMVTALDSSANVVVFEKNYNIHYKEFNIYREGIYLGIFEKLSSVPSSSAGIYIDHVDPRAQAYLYKMTGVESNNEETDINLCQTHKTMHLRVSRGVPSGFQLDWDEYVGFPYSTYYIYRSVDGGKKFDTIHVMSSSTHSWTDYSAPSGYLLYFVAVEKKDGACYPDGKRKAGSDIYSQSVSNMEDNRIQNSGIPEIEANKYEFSCYPNPFSDFTRISYNLPVQSDVRLEVYNLLGEKVVTLFNTRQFAGLHQYRFSATEYGLSSGVYFIQFKTGGSVIMKKLVETK